MATQRSWKSWSVVSVVLFGVIVGTLALSQQAPAGPNVTVYESPT